MIWAAAPVVKAKKTGHQCLRGSASAGKGLVNSRREGLPTGRGLAKCKI
jgi:hypothetical protein